VLAAPWIKKDGMKTYVCLAIIILFAADLDNARGNGHTFFFLAVLFDHRALFPGVKILGLTICGCT
jgi:hypothetical protein